MSFEVQEFTLFDGWINNWSYYDDKGELKPSVFNSYDEAEFELDCLLQDLQEAYSRGDMGDVPSRDEFRIVEV